MKFTPQIAIHDWAYSVPFGHQARVVADSMEVITRYEIAELAALIASHDSNNKPNPNYPAELQPRNRARIASTSQIAAIAGNLDPQRLAAARVASEGAPLIGDDNVVESGNARVLALRRAYRAGKADHYREWLADNAESLGLYPQWAIDLREPVLIRRRLTALQDKDRVSLCHSANKSTVAVMSPTEKATADAALINADLLELYRPTIDGDLLARSNQPFMQGFARLLSDTEQAGMVTSDGRWNRVIVERARAAIFAGTYQNEQLINLMAEEANPDLKNIINALTAAAGNFAKAKAGFQELAQQFDLTRIICDAVELVRKSRQLNVSLTTLTNQGDFFGESDPAVEQAAMLLDANIRKPRILATILVKWADHWSSLLSLTAHPQLSGLELPLPDMPEYIEQLVSLADPQPAMVQAELI